MDRSRWTSQHMDVCAGRPVRRVLIPIRAAMMGLTLCLFVSAGCSEMFEAPAPQSSAAGWTPLRLPGTAPDVACEAGLRAMRQYFPAAKTVSAGRTIESGTVEYTQAGGTGRFRDGALKFKNRMRRMATLQITETASGCLVRCQVRRQRLDTADHRTFRQQRMFEDVPNETPIDRGAGASPSQSEQWTEMQRDIALEREMLDVLFNQVPKTDVPKTET